jgi:hypothetical protein
MLPDFKDLEISTLYDLLADYTSKYTLMMRWGNPSNGFDECKDIILQLQKEIDSRKPSEDVQEDKDLDDGMELIPAIA